MRTVLLLGLIYVGTCINPICIENISGKGLEVFVIVLIASVCMDITEFLKKMLKQ